MARWFKPGGSYPQTLNFVILQPAQAGKLLCVCSGQRHKTVYEYPGTLQNRRSALSLTIQRPDVVVSAYQRTGYRQWWHNRLLLLTMDENNGAGAVFNQLRNDRLYIRLLHLMVWH